MFISLPPPLVMSCLGSQWLGSPSSSLPIPFPPQPGAGLSRRGTRDGTGTALEVSEGPGVRNQPASSLPGQAIKPWEWDPGSWEVLGRAWGSGSSVL